MTRRPLAAALALALALGAGGVLLTASPASAATLTVTTDADAGAGSLRAAVAAAGPGDVIVFDGSVHEIALQSALVVTAGITIDGGGQVELSRADTSTFTQLVLAPTAADQDYTLRGLEISAHGGAEGGAIVASDASGWWPRDVTLSALDVHDQLASEAPIAALNHLTGDVLVEHSVFTDNTSIGSSSDGGISIENVSGASIRIVDSVFTGNQAGYGGAVELHELTDSTVEISGSSFTGNAAVFSGGAVLFWYSPTSTISITGSEFVNNASGDTGGAVSAAWSGRVTVSGSTFAFNSANWSGALEAYDLEGLTIDASTFSDNASASEGGAVAAESIAIPVVITGSTFARNEAPTGGALLLDGGVGLTVRTSSFTGNRFSDHGGAIATFDDVDAPILIDSSTFSGQFATGANPEPEGLSLWLGEVYDGSLDIVNSTIDELAPGSAVHVGELHGSATIRSTTVRSAFLDFPGILGGALQITDSVLESTVDGDDPVRVALFEGGIATAAYSIFGGPLGEVDEGAGVLESTDPVLGSLADNGGATRTRMPLDGSPAVDGGDPAFAAPPALDQRGAGFARVSGGRVDIGALEVQQAAPELAATGPDAVDRPLGLALGVLLLGALLVAAGMTLARRRGGVSASG